MPKRLASGNSLGLLSRLARRSGQTAIAPRNRDVLKRACIDTLEGRTFFSTTYFVSPAGNDSAAGNLSQPFRTIQQAANVANTGDTVDIEAGTYREAIHPTHSGVTFTNYNGQSVTVSGANVVSGFTSVGNSIYQAQSPVNLGGDNNQLFVDGQMVTEARWPANNYQSTVSSYSNGVIYDPSITQGNGYWNGATIHITPGDGWVSYTGTVNNSGPGWISVSLPSLSSYETPMGGNSYYLTGTYNAMNSAGQFYMDGSSHLYLRDPGSDNPASHTVEVKARAYAFDLSGVANTTIQGLNIFAATIHTDWASSGTVINGINASYITHFVDDWNGWSPPGPAGIELNGSGSILENSTIGGAAGDGVFVGANNVTVNNNIIHDVDYSGTDGAGVRTYSSGINITNNTIYNTGRDGINFQSSSINVTGNTIHDFMQLTYDGGGIYTVHTNGNGSTIAYNTIYNAHDNNYNGLDAAGILLDNDSSNFNVHDNVTANVDAGFKANNTSYGEQVYNNKFGGTQYAIESNGWVGFAYDWGGSNVHDNVFYNPTLKLGANIGQWNNSFAGGSPTLPGGNTTSPPPSPPPSPVPPPAPTPTPAATATATLLNADTTTAGSWSSYYGADGYSLFNSTSNLPSYAQVTASGDQTYTWAASTSDTRALQTAPGSGTRIAACDYSGGSFTLDVNLTDGKTHEAALSLLDWDANGRSETVQVIDAGTGTVLNSQNVSNFSKGEYLVWNLSGHVQINITRTGGVNAVASALIFGGGTGAVTSPPVTSPPVTSPPVTSPPAVSPPPTAPAGSSAQFVRDDSTTAGNWTGAYGSDGESIFNGTTGLPAYATVTTSGAQSWTWASSTTDSRALLTSAGATPRMASCLYSSSSFSLGVNLTDGQSHQVGLYLLDYDNNGRSEKVQVTDAANGKLLDTENVSNFSGGQYLVWNLSGNVNITLTNAGGKNAVASGLFFGPATPTAPTAGPTAIFKRADTTTAGTWTGSFGGEGYSVMGGTSALPTYAQVVTTGALNYVWTGLTSDVRAAQSSAGSGNRVAGCNYSSSSFSYDINLTDGKSHQLAVYLLDWDGLNRAQTIQITDATSGAVLDTETASNFTKGEYLAWNVSGHVKVTVTRTAGQNAVVSGLFFGPPT